MKTMRRGLFALTAAACALLAGCGVGTYHIPTVEPVIKPEPEEDMFGDLDLESGGSSTGSTTETPKSEEAPKSEGGTEGQAAGGEAKPAEGKGAKPAEGKTEAKPAEGKAAETKAGETKPAETKPAPKTAPKKK